MSKYSQVCVSKNGKRTETHPILQEAKDVSAGSQNQVRKCKFPECQVGSGKGTDEKRVRLRSTDGRSKEGHGGQGHITENDITGKYNKEKVKIYKELIDNSSELLIPSTTTLIKSIVGMLKKDEMKNDDKLRQLLARAAYIL